MCQSCRYPDKDRANTYRSASNARQDQVLINTGSQAQMLPALRFEQCQPRFGKGVISSCKVLVVSEVEMFDRMVPIPIPALASSPINK